VHLVVMRVTLLQSLCKCVLMRLLVVKMSLPTRSTACLDSAFLNNQLELL